MARADLLLDLVRAGARGNRPLFRRALEALIAEERSKQHHILADRLAAHLSFDGGGQPTPALEPLRRSASEPYFETHPDRKLIDLFLPEAVATACREVLEEHRRGDLLRAHNLEPRHRILLAGPPGNGKTSLAEALAHEFGVPLLIVRYEAVIASYLGETAVRLSRLFDEVRTRRSVVFFDEFDVVGKERGDLHETGEIKRVVSSLLLKVDELPSHVIAIAATNHPELLDRAVWRRFQLRMELPPPTHGQAQEWFKRFEARLKTKLRPSPSTLAKKLAGLSFAELEDFSLDVQRRYVLSIPAANLARIISSVLKQWEHRFRARPASVSSKRGAVQGKAHD